MGWRYALAGAGILVVAGVLIAACVNAHEWNGVLVVVFLAGNTVDATGTRMVGTAMTHLVSYLSPSEAASLTAALAFVAEQAQRARARVDAINTDAAHAAGREAR